MPRKPINQVSFRNDDGAAILCKPEILATSRHGSVQPLPQGLIAFIFRKVELCCPILADVIHGGSPRRILTVETRVRAWKAVLVTIVPMDVEPADPVHALKLLEPVERNFTGTGDELQQLGPFFLVKRAHRTPEPLDLRRRGRIVVIFGVHLPVIHVNFRKTRDQQFELLLVEDGDEIGRNDFMES